MTFSTVKMLSENGILSAKSMIEDLNLTQQRFVSKLPLIITILGLIGFVGNLFTFLQPTLRKNAFCIYTLSASLIDIINLSVNLCPQYFNPSPGGLFAEISDRFTCKLRLFALVVLPQLSLNLLIMSLVDRFACTFPSTSRMSRLLKLKMVPLMIFITIIISSIESLYSPLLYDIIPDYGCGVTHATENAVSYIAIHGILTPAIMVTLVGLTYRRFSRGRQRVGAVTTANQNRFRNQFVAMVFTQVFVSSFFVLQWIGMYWYFLATQYDNKTAEQWTITYFMLSLTNNFYYMINVRSFYLSTLTSRLFRETMMAGFLKLLPGNLHRQWNARNLTAPNTIGTRTVE
ncbi:unnamed protein product [Adineta ricciae]|uniref:G-protein coupled receptors family 1 profile domain-containing protein n=1 Tax=Adineta ricciae TaxID=249248 RepID=A0A815UYR0_ADIRI|nr:unnamed protein product [Adineta ricciae]CAF1523583.1 unnamed protein product [Adineta ricciae]